MSAKDLSMLSYKELQALAVKHRVPGNIKKVLLLKILNAVRSGNSSEVTKILTDLKKNRKKRTKRAKAMKEKEDDSLKLELSNTADLPLQDHYLFPMQQQQQQQQYPFEWLGTSQIGAEEEVKCSLSYNDIRQFIFLNCDRNNNQTLLDQIVDLRTEATVSNYRSNVGTNLINSSSQQQSITQPPSSDSASKKMSLLLKKMLQAPAGANLGEIASPVSTWPTDTYHFREPSPDNSETMSARSDINENDEIWQSSITPTIPNLSCTVENNQSYLNPYCRRNNDVSYYRSPLDNVGDQTILGYEQQNTCNQYQFNYTPQTDAQENCRSWLASSTLDMANPVNYETPSPLKLAPTASIHYQSPGSSDLLNPSPVDSSNIVQSNSQYCLYTNQGPNILEPSEIVPDLNFDVSQYYEMSNTVKTQESQDYYRQLCSGIATSTFSPDFYDNTQQQQVPQQQQQQSTEKSNISNFSDYTQQFTNPIFHVELENTSFDSGYYQQPQQSNNIVHQQNPSVNQALATSVPTATDPLQELQNQSFENFVEMPTSSTAQNNSLPIYGTGVLDNYWPRWSYLDKETVTSKTNGHSLEITLNLRSSNGNVDFSKLNDTCCVYSNTTPVMTLRKGLNSVPSRFEGKTNCSTGFNNADDRPHNFASNWLLYNDEANRDVNSNRSNITPSFSTSMAGYCLTEQHPQGMM